MNIPSRYHIIALVLIGIGVIGIGLHSFILTAPGFPGLLMLFLRPPKPPPRR